MFGEYVHYPMQMFWVILVLKEKWKQTFVLLAVISSLLFMQAEYLYLSSINADITIMQPLISLRCKLEDAGRNSALRKLQVKRHYSWLADA